MGISNPGTVSVVVPTLNEAGVLAATLARAGEAFEIIVADGGSDDDTLGIAQAAGARVVTGAPGRGLQQNAGAQSARGDVLLFLHADTQLPEGFADAVVGCLAGSGRVWGRFDVRFDAGGPLLRLIAHLISWRSWVTGVATGDQAIFITREVFEQSGGFREPQLFEDIELCRRLKRVSRPAIPAIPLTTSSRRWREGGVIRTSLLMWGLKTAYLAGVSSSRLARVYHDVR